MAPEYTKNKKNNPFPGLRPFGPGESNYFFGRNAECEEIAGKLLANRFVAVIGASGSGKSSLIQCGLLPKLRSLTSGEGSTWTSILLKPGNDPFTRLADAFADTSPNNLQNKLERNEILKILKENQDGILLVLNRLLSKAGSKIVLIVDQFEELFRYGSPEVGIGSGKETVGFINLLSAAISRENPDFYTVIALRSDLISECSHYKTFTNLVNNSNFLVPGMNKESLKEVIERPLKNAGARIDPELVEKIINECGDNSDQLPVLQHALFRLWTNWKELDEPDKPLEFSDYAPIGSISDAISYQADQVYEKLSQGEKEVCEKIFKIITGKGADNKGIRYPSNVITLRSAVSCTSQELIGVIDKFRNPSISILTPEYNIKLVDESIIDLSHESLIHLWGRLKKWVDEEAASVLMYINLSEASALYQQGKAGLLKQPDLQLAINWRDQTKPTLWWAQKYNPAFERAMVYLRTSEKEFIESEEKKARQHRWRLHKIRIISSILAGIVVITGLSMIGAFISKLNADTKRRDAERQKAEVISQKSATEEYATIVVKRSIAADSTVVVATRREEQEKQLREVAENRVFSAEMDAKEAKSLRMVAQRLSDSAIKASVEADMKALTANEKSIETQRLRMISIAKSLSLRSMQMEEQADLQAVLAYQAYLFNRKNNGYHNDADIYLGLYKVAKQNHSDNIRNYPDGHTGQIRSLAFLPGKKEFFTSGSDGKVLKWNMDRSDQSFQIIYSNSEIIDVLAVSPKADWLACGEENSAIKMIPLDNNNSQYELKGHTGKIKSLIFSYDGKYLYSAALDGKVLKWDLAARTSANLNGNTLEITSIDLSSNGKYIAGISKGGEALVWNPEAISNRFTIGTTGKAIRSIRFKPDEERIAVGYDDGMVEIWDLGKRQKISEFKAHSGNVNEIRFNSDLLQIATSGEDGTLKLWDLNDQTNLPVSFNDNGGLIVAFEFSSDGKVILSGTLDGKPELVERPTYADTFAADGCKYVKRNFTPDEWLAFVGKDITYEKTCPEAEYKIKIREIK